MTTIARPRPGPPRTYHFPDFERRILDNGIRLIVAPVPRLPLVTVTVIADAGAVADLRDREGTAVLAAQSLLEGPVTGESVPVTDRFEQLGASIDARADWDAAYVQLTVMKGQLPAALDLLGAVLAEPSLPEREVERLKGERLAELLQMRTEPRELADVMFERFLYEGASRFACPEAGTERSVPAIGREEVARFIASRYGPGTMTVILAGDVTAEEGDRLMRRTLGTLAGEPAEPCQARAVAAREQRAVHIVRKDEAPQSELRIGHLGLPRRHPDYFPVSVMNALLGGLFSSRINLNLRERHGFTYGASSYYDWRRQAGPFVVSTAVRSDVTEAAAVEVVREIDRIREAPVPAEELSLATSYLDGVFPIRFETTASIASALASLVVYGLPDDYYDRYRSEIRGVTADRVREAARSHLHPEALQFVVVGDPDAIAEPLGRAGFGPVAIYDAEGRPIAR